MCRRPSGRPRSRSCGVSRRLRGSEGFALKTQGRGLWYRRAPMATPAEAVSAPPAAQASTRYPAKAFFVIFTEGAERMSFYGLTAILTDHWVQNLHWSEAEATIGWSRFSTATYLAPLLGGF